jgi:hypothetical protein
VTTKKHNQSIIRRLPNIHHTNMNIESPHHHMNISHFPDHQFTFIYFSHPSLKNNEEDDNDVIDEWEMIPSIHRSRIQKIQVCAFRKDGMAFFNHDETESRNSEHEKIQTNFRTTSKLTAILFFFFLGSDKAKRK